MEVRIARLSMLLNRAVESSAKTNTNFGESGEKFSTGVDFAPIENEEENQSKAEIDSHAAYLSLSSKGSKHSRLLIWPEDLKSEDVSGILSVDDDSLERSSMTSQSQMADKLDGLSNQVINGELSATDKMNFDTELKALKALLDNADDESKRQLLSNRINDLSILINDATEYRNNHIALNKLTDPDYDKYE